MAHNTKGSRRERELCTTLDSHGFAVIRAPASGSATQRELPDVFAGHDGTLLAFEAKASKRDEYIYLTEEEVANLEWFAMQFGAEPRVAARYDYNDWAFFDPETLYRTPEGNYRVTEDDLPDGETIDDLL